MIIKFPELAAQAMKIFKTDMSPTLAVQLAGFVQNELGRERMFFSMLPGEPVMIDRLSYWMGDVKAANAFLEAPVEALISGDVTEGNGRNAKQVPFTSAGDGAVSKDASAEDKAAPAAAAGAKKDEMTKEELLALIKSLPESVAVLNGTGRAGVSSEISTRLQQLGVDVVHAGNAKHFDYQHCNIVYPTNASDKVKTTARQLGVLLKIPKNLVRPSQQAFYASIIAGHDYKKLTTLLDNMLKISSQQ